MGEKCRMLNIKKKLKRERKIDKNSKKQNNVIDRVKKYKENRMMVLKIKE